MILLLDGERRRRRLIRFLGVLQIKLESRQESSPEEAFAARGELAAFAQLPPEQRAVLMIVAVEGLSYQEAADVLGVPIGTIMSRLSRGRSALARAADAAAPPLRLVRRGA